MKRCVYLAVVVLIAGVSIAQAQGRGGAQAPQVTSPEVSADRRVSFRIYAPQAREIRLSASDIPGLGQNTRLTKADTGVWELTTPPLESGAYRYNFNVDGVATIDPRNATISESNNNVWSLVYVPGSDLFDSKAVPHGAIAEVTYKSSALGRDRRMHVYTPPGYQNGRDRYPVFYLLHGAGDNDDSWTTVGRAGFILDNLIATQKARPMVVVMPAGHASSAQANVVGRSATDDFVNDFVKDVMPHVEKNYRVLTDRANTAIAGLSMGGGQTLNVAIPNLEQYGYVGVYSSGLLGGFPDLMRRPPGAPAGPAPRMGPTADEWTKMHAAKLADPALKKGLLLWFATGKDDFLLTTTQATVALFEKQGFSPVFKLTEGGHTWINWRNYLTEFAPQLFRGAGASSSARK